MKKTHDEAMQEYISLRNDDVDFEKQWNKNMEDFYEWCSYYKDLEHIKKEVLQ